MLRYLHRSAHLILPTTYEVGFIVSVLYVGKLRLAMSESFLDFTYMKMMKLEIIFRILILEAVFNHYIALPVHLPARLIQVGLLAAVLGICDPTILITGIR